MSSILSYENVTAQTFSEQIANLHTKTKKTKKQGLVLSESWRPYDFRTPWIYTMTKEFEEEMILQT